MAATEEIQRLIDTLSKITDKRRVNHLVAVWTAQAGDIVRAEADHARVMELEKKVADATKPEPTTKAGRLFTTEEARRALKISERLFREYLGSGQLHPMPGSIAGNHHRFTLDELERFTAIPSGERLFNLGIYRAKKKREAQTKKVVKAKGQTTKANRSISDSGAAL